MRVWVCIAQVDEIFQFNSQWSGWKKLNPTQPIIGVQPNPRGSGWTHVLENLKKEIEKERNL